MLSMKARLVARFVKEVFRETKKLEIVQLKPPPQAPDDKSKQAQAKAELVASKKQSEGEWKAICVLPPQSLASQSTSRGDDSS